MAVTPDGNAFVFVTVGTDHHPFDRLVGWIDAWLEGKAREAVRCFVQRGTSSRPARAASSDFLEYEALRAAMREADAVVCHGGPGTILLAAEAGKLPIVVPRLRALGEHVDDHQLIFARRMAREGALALAEDEERFRTLLDLTLAAPETHAAVPSSGTSEAVRRFEEIVGELMVREEGRLAELVR
jgi:UDP-N-acetylglucosamine transferase subunit ALG13